MDALVLATGNTGKVREMADLLAGPGIRVHAQSEFEVPAAAETGLSFVENALLKARQAARFTDLPALADDSGLCVDALHGAPGIYSARYAGEDASDENNNRKLLERLGDLPDRQRTAFFHCALVLVRNAQDAVPFICQASWHGRILHAPRGEGGFGYDPLFLPNGQTRTSAELDPAEKNRISHRGQAMRLLLEALQR